MGRESRIEPPAMADIRRLISGIKKLRREAQTLRLRCWQGEDRIAELEAALREAEAARQGSLDRLRELEGEIAALRCFAGGSPLACGFRPGEGAMLAGGAVRRAKAAPSGTMIFGPYIRLSPGRYVVTLRARLYEPAAAAASFTVDAVYGCGQRVIAVRHFRAWPLLPARTCRLAFWTTEEINDFETRVWARAGTPLEISRIALHPIGAATAFSTLGAPAAPADAMA